MFLTALSALAVCAPTFAQAVFSPLPAYSSMEVPRKALYEYRQGTATFRDGPSQLFHYNNICAYGQ